MAGATPGGVQGEIALYGRDPTEGVHVVAAVGGDVRSEVGALQTVLVHRPGTELSRITPGNMEELLFDELLWVERAQSEHDAFVHVMEQAGTEVLYVERLLADVLADPEVARSVVEDQVTARECGPQLVDRVRDYLLGLGTEALVDHLIGGVTLEEVGASGGIVGQLTPMSQTLLHPLPNTVFMRDSSAWIGDRVMLSPMNRQVRRRETALLQVVYQAHPRFAGSGFWFGAEAPSMFPATVEGGDVLVVGDRGLAIGISERTSPQGVELLAAQLFEAGVVDRVLAVDLPKVRAAMHLDTVVTMVDIDAFIVYPSILSGVHAYRVTPRTDGGVHVDESPSLVQGLAWAAGLDHARAIEPALGSVRAEREQWNDANNTLALAPGVVVAYERNVATNEILTTAGIDVRTIPSYELPRGRGGPRCMSCPVRRAPL